MTTLNNQRKLDKLAALEAAGVDNWEHYDLALADWFEEGRKEDLITTFIETLDDIIGEATVNEPAGYRAGYLITYDTDSVEKALYKLIEDFSK